mmetsp:Transcript_33646/g.95160  ORF Transcript_33646/g.95160 Transcript_33646/m.95160 type:complete len:201 (+) Transcript_33646:320-922(+)
MTTWRSRSRRSRLMMGPKRSPRRANAAKWRTTKNPALRRAVASTAPAPSPGTVTAPAASATPAPSPGTATSRVTATGRGPGTGPGTWGGTGTRMEVAATAEAIALGPGSAGTFPLPGGSAPHRRSELSGRGTGSWRSWSVTRELCLPTMSTPGPLTRTSSSSSRRRAPSWTSASSLTGTPSAPRALPTSRCPTSLRSQAP